MCVSSAIYYSIEPALCAQPDAAIAVEWNFQASKKIAAAQENRGQNYCSLFKLGKKTLPQCINQEGRVTSAYFTPPGAFVNGFRNLLECQSFLLLAHYSR
jgi:hypothetical protein